MRLYMRSINILLQELRLGFCSRKQAINDDIPEKLQYAGSTDVIISKAGKFCSIIAYDLVQRRSRRFQ